MQLVPSKQVKEGMCVAREVRDAQGRILLGRGQRMTASLILRLYKFQVEAIYVRDGYGDAEPEMVKAEVRQKCQEVLNASFSNLAQEAAEKRLSMDAQAIHKASEQLIDSLLATPNPLVTLLDIGTSGDRLMQHSVNTAVLAVTLALDMNIPPQMLIHLATAMMFHDMGMTLLPEEIAQKETPPTAAEIALLRKHPDLGFEHLVQTNAVSNVAANIVLRHHEMLDGSGYPHGIGADKLSVLMRIASVAEAYDSMTSKRFGAPAVMPDAAITYIIRNVGKLFAKEAVLALCHRVALYPTGIAVQLNTGESGIVARTTPLAPTRPAVYIHLDHRARKLEAPQLLDLSRDTMRFVVRSAPNLMQLLQMQAASAPPKPVDPVLAAIG